MVIILSHPSSFLPNLFFLIQLAFRALTVSNEILHLRSQVDEKAAALDAQVTSSQVGLGTASVT
jgi:cell division protein FtsL